MRPKVRRGEFLYKAGPSGLFRKSGPRAAPRFVVSPHRIGFKKRRRSGLPLPGTVE